VGGFNSKKSSNSWEELAVPFIRLMIWHFTTVRLKKEKGKRYVHYTPLYVHVKNLIHWRLYDVLLFISCSELGHWEIADKLVRVYILLHLVLSAEGHRRFASSSWTLIYKQTDVRVQEHSW
jgi:hypothetical protein